MKDTEKVYVGLSGGVDSSTTAALLLREGFDVTGVYMKNWTQDVGGYECPWRQDLADAQGVAARLGIRFEIFDFESEYRERVVDYMIREYQAGRTPNPDIMCNSEVKFKLFLDTALARGADAIATGHYVRVRGDRLYAGVDSGKDQSYFLYRITKEAIGKSYFPLGQYEKSEVRKLAQDFKLPTATKPDSQGICFIGEVSIHEFLADYIETSPGPIKHVDGRTLGEHEGAVFYTIGQRQGLGIGGGLPLYVASKDMATNTIYVTEDLTALMSREITIDNLHWIHEPPRSNDEYLVRVRHLGRLTPAQIETSDGEAVIHLKEPERAVTAGQSAVIYQATSIGLEVVGGGIIKPPLLRL